MSDVAGGAVSFLILLALLALRVPIGVALGGWLLGESLSPTAWVGLGCVVVGVAAMTIPARKAMPKAA